MFHGRKQSSQPLRVVMGNVGPCLEAKAGRVLLSLLQMFAARLSLDME